MFLGILIFDIVPSMGIKNSLYRLNKISRREISNKLNYSQNRARMRKLHDKQYKVKFWVLVYFRGHNFLFRGRIGEHEKYIEIP